MPQNEALPGERYGPFSKPSEQVHWASTCERAMPSTLTAVEFVRFGKHEAHLRSRELRCDGVTVLLPDQSFEVLAMLLEQPGELVAREDLRKRFWPADTFVDFDHGLNNAVKRLRDALGDSADVPQFIETLPRRGYRFIGKVDTMEPEPVV